ncbi:MAG: T9SS type A sorting domain-containing protein [Candidatus Margulisiibacteriota bacterium]
MNKLVIGISLVIVSWLLVIPAVADSTAPTCTFNHLAFDISTNNQPIISGEATDTESEISRVEWRVDGGSFATAILSGFSADRKTATFTFESTALDRDTVSHRFEVRATDAAGNINTTFTSYSVYIIGDRPEMGLNINGRAAVNGDTILAAPSFEVTVIVAPTRSLTTLYYTLDGGTRQTLTGINPDNAKITYAFISPQLNDGLHSIVYEVVDSAGSVSTLEANNLIVQSAAGTSVQGLALNYPNPFNPETTSTSIAYTLSKASNINLTIHDLMGNQLVKQTYFINTNGGRVGYNEVTWNGKSDSGDMVGNGIYIYLIIADGKPIGRGKVTVLKK